MSNITNYYNSSIAKKPKKGRKNSYWSQNATYSIHHLSYNSISNSSSSSSYSNRNSNISSNNVNEGALEDNINNYACSNNILQQDAIVPHGSEPPFNNTATTTSTTTTITTTSGAARDVIDNKMNPPFAVSSIVRPSFGSTEKVAGPAVLTHPPAHGDTPPPKVVVVGAGVAGLCAARKLQDSGYDVIVLEARDRIGGRIHTECVSENNFVDMGASYIHGCDPDGENVMYEFLKEHKIQLCTRDPFSTEWLTKNGKQVKESVVQKIRKEIERAEEKLLELAEERQEGGLPDISLQEALPKCASCSVTNQERLIFNHMIASEFAYNAETSQLSLYDCLEASENGIPDGPTCIVVRGYKQVIDILARGLKILTRQVVHTIDYGSAFGVNIMTDSSTFYANHVIITLPIGVLQRHYQTMFHPSLPLKKQKAIEGIGMGLENKVILVFKEIFWGKDKHYLRCVDDMRFRFVNAHAIGQPGTLYTFICPPYSVQLEKESDDYIINEILSTLRSMYGNHIDKPVYASVTRWGSDPFALGAYSYIPVGSSVEMMKDLAEPDSEKLWFAGEATNFLDSQTVHGAYSSGLAVADSILQLKTKQALSVINKSRKRKLSDLTDYEYVYATPNSQDQDKLASILEQENELRNFLQFYYEIDENMAEVKVKRSSVCSLYFAKAATHYQFTSNCDINSRILNYIYDSVSKSVIQRFVQKRNTKNRNVHDDDWKPKTPSRRKSSSSTNNADSNKSAEISNLVVVPTLFVSPAATTSSSSVPLTLVPVKTERTLRSRAKASDKDIKSIYSSDDDVGQQKRESSMPSDVCRDEFESVLKYATHLPFIKLIPPEKLDTKADWARTHPNWRYTTKDLTSTKEKAEALSD